MDGIGAGSKGLSEHDCARSTGGPPSVAVNDVVGDRDVVREVGADARGGKVMNVVSSSLDAGGFIDFDTLSIEVGERLSNASLGTRPLAFVSS